ncbi:MAG: PEP/pyruvate-binding domain-containing protein, partial [Oscillospiraceae bacterium]
MTIYKIGGEMKAENVGNKAASLSYMKKNGFNVPDGFVLDRMAFSDTIEQNGLKPDLIRLLLGLDSSRCEKIAEEISVLFKNILLPDYVLKEISSNIDERKKYAVRSSGIKEDLEGFSFAGQYKTFINISGADNIAAAVADCFRSVFSKVVLTYLADNKL